MFFVGDTVKIAESDQFRWTLPTKAGKIGKIEEIDSSDGSFYVCFNDGTCVWFEADELVPMLKSFSSVGEAVDFLIGSGYRVTLEKLQ